MKQLIMTIAFMAGVGCLSASAQTRIEIPTSGIGSTCPDNYTRVTSSCGEKSCFTMRSGNSNETYTYRSLNQTEFETATDDTDARCPVFEEPITPNE